MCQGRGNFALSFYILFAGLRIKLTGTLTGKKSNKCLITCIHGRDPEKPCYYPKWPKPSLEILFSAKDKRRCLRWGESVLGGDQEKHSRQEYGCWASLVAQWLRICLLMQGTRVRALVWEDPTCHGAAGPVSHNY